MVNRDFFEMVMHHKNNILKMKNRVKISFESELLEILIPGASSIDELPRKKKKRLKKLIAKKLIEIAVNEILRNDAFDKLSSLKQ